MSLIYSPSVVTNGLIMYYDMHNTQKSWAGAPTQNIIAADFDTTFESYPLGSNAGFDNQLGTGNSMGVSGNIAYSGTKSLLVNKGVDGNGRIYHYIPLNLGDYCTASAWVYSTVPGAYLYMEYAGGAPYNWYVEGGLTYNYHTGNGWEFLYAKAGAATVAACTCYYFFYPVVNGKNIYIDLIQVEKNQFATPYVNGTRSNTESINDLTNINTLTASGLVYNSDRSFSFNGSSSSVNSSTINLQQDWTYECWANHSVVNGFAFLGQGTAGDSGAALHIWHNSSTNIRFGMWANDTDYSIVTSPNTWYHYVFTYKSTSPFTKQLYRNGVLVSDTPLQAPALYTGTGTVRIGATYSSGGNYANGKINSAKIYNRVLSAAEVQQNFNACRSRYGI